MHFSRLLGLALIPAASFSETVAVLSVCTGAAILPATNFVAECPEYDAQGHVVQEDDGMGGQMDKERAVEIDVVANKCVTWMAGGIIGVMDIYNPNQHFKLTF